MAEKSQYLKTIRYICIYIFFKIKKENDANGRPFSVSFFLIFPPLFTNEEITS